jgi:hypothetical protein
METAKTSAEVDTSAASSPIVDIKKLVDFCNKYNLNEESKRKSRVVHETDCVLTKYSHLDVNCQCFRHKSYVVHGKWFFS